MTSAQLGDWAVDATSTTRFTHLIKHTAAWWQKPRRLCMSPRPAVGLDLLLEVLDAELPCKATKPAALFTAVVGVAIVVFGIVNVGNKPNGHGFIWLWAAIGLGILGFGLWSAFSLRGGTQIISTDADQPPHRPGMTTGTPGNFHRTGVTGRSSNMHPGHL